MAKQTITLTNLLTNPSFENTGWQANANCSVAYDSSIKHSGSYSLKVTSTSSNESLIVTTDTYSLTQNHIYYVSVWFYETANNVGSMQCYWPIAEPLIGTATVDSTKLNQWQQLTWRNVRSSWSTGTAQTFRFDFEGMASGKIAYIDDAMLIDLTAAFGSGNEPTQSWCDTNIEYFAGNTTIQYEAPTVYDLTSTTPTRIKTGDILNCPYSGSAKQITLPKGQYKLECWGAQGGYRSSSSCGGNGGYSVGILNLTQNTTVYLYVGGAGNTGKTAGGFNGGGRRSSYNGGGGGTDIRIGSNSLYARVIVAGGGGSDGASNKNGMYGGGTSGGTTTQSFGSGGGGGTQTAGGAGGSNNAGTFGQGGQGLSASSGYGGAGGGGWYGGGGSYPDGSGDDDRGGGGGSGYVYTSSTASNYPSGCLLNSSYYLTNAQTMAGNAEFTSPTGTNEMGHRDNGYIRITVIKAGSGNTLVKIDSTTWKNQKNIFIKTGASTTVPSELVELEYIESTGTQYIDTGFKPNQDTRIVGDMQFLNNTSGDPASLFGYRQSTSAQRYEFFQYNSLLYSPYNKSAGSTLSLTTNKITIDKNKGITTVNGSTLSNIAYENFQCSGNLYLFALNNNGSVTFVEGHKRLYSCKIYNNNTLIRDFIPVKRVSDNKCGLWDKVTKAFYPNAGTGTFTAGPAVNLTGWHKIKGIWAKTAVDTWSQAL